MKTINLKQMKTKSIILLSIFIVSAFLLGPSLNSTNNSIANTKANNDLQEINLNINNESPKTSNSVSNSEWWDGDWRFRIPLTTSLCEYKKMDIHVYSTINFTKYLQILGVSGETFDVNSIRLIEYLDENTYFETPYKINGSSANPEKIQIVWILNGTTLADTSRLFYLYFDTDEFGPKTAPTYENLFSGTRSQYENDYLILDDQINWYSWTDSTTQLTGAESKSLTDGTYIAGDNAFRSNGNDHFQGWSLINYPPFNFSVGDNDDQIRYIDVWWYYMDSNADISLQIQDDGSWAKRWGYDVDPVFDGYSWTREGNYVNQDANKWRFYRMDLVDQLHMTPDSWITGLAFSSDNGDVIYDHIMFEKYNTTDIILGTEPEKKTAEMTIITKDVDGQVVVGAEVYLLNLSATVPIVKSGVSNEQGEVIFENVTYGVYNITVNYTLTPGLERVVYNSSQLGVKYNITTLYPIIYLKLDLWTIGFKIQDQDEKDINLGYINVKEKYGGSSLINLTLDETGCQNFVWSNKSSYYYEIYYNNDDYTPKETLIDNGTVSRKTKFINSTTINVVDYNEYGSSQREYKAEKSFLVSGTNQSGSTYEIGFQTIVSANITLTNMQENLTSVNVWYIDKNGEDDGTDYLLVSKSYTTETSDFLSFNLTGVKEAYGLRIIVIGENRSTCSGTINVSFTETQTEHVNVNMSSMEIYVTTETGEPVSNLIVKITNSTTGAEIVQLTTSSGNAKDASGNPFWYLRGDYNISLIFYGNYINFNLTSGQPKTTDSKKIILDTYTTLNVDGLLDPTKYRSAFNDTMGDQTVIWRQNIYFRVNFTISEDSGKNWTAIEEPATVTYYLKTISNIILFTGNMDPQGYGYYDKTLNSSILIADNNYKIMLFGYKQGYIEPTPVTFFITITPIPTSTSLHNWNNPAQTVTQFSGYYNELVNITVSYYPTGSPSKRLLGALLGYNWDYGSDSNIGEDPLHPGYYSLEINTSLAPTIAQYGIDISISLENYTTYSFVTLLGILPRITTINETKSLLHNSTSIWVNNSFVFYYEYVDTLVPEKVEGLEVATYYWYKLDADGNPIGDPSEEINLVETSDHVYQLDFNTENRKTGDYALFITLQKNNYEARNALINLEIKYREITAKISATNKEGSLVSIVKGQPIVFSIKLTDPTKGSSSSSGGTSTTQATVPLKGATIKITLTELNKTYTFKEVADGVYNLTIATTDPIYEAFFTPQTITAVITIEKEYYETESIEITIVVGMEEILPGFPLFYFILLVIAVGSVVGSLATYRYIQVAKIPNFVKKARAMGKAVKGHEEISESLLYPEKEAFIAKRLGEKWKMIGLSLEEILGVKSKKESTISKIMGTKDKTEGGVA